MLSSCADWRCGTITLPQAEAEDPSCLSPLGVPSITPLFLLPLSLLLLPLFLPSQVFKFSFPKVEMPYESYEGINARCRYLLRAVIARTGYSGPLLKEQDFLVQIAEPVSQAKSRDILCCAMLCCASQ